MYSFSVLLICATALILVQCNDHRSPTSRFDKIVTEPRESCQPNSREYKRARHQVMMDSTCKPHPRHVVLQPEPGQIVMPSMVTVPRCDGRCTNGLMCGPITTGTIKVPVTVMNEATRMQFYPNQCTYVEVEEHRRCGCMCNVKATDCNPANQQYVSDQCKCMCTNIVEKENCRSGSSKSGMLWDEETCQCQCVTKNMECTTGKRWNDTTCKCEV